MKRKTVTFKIYSLKHETERERKRKRLDDALSLSFLLHSTVAQSGAHTSSNGFNGVGFEANSETNLPITSSGEHTVLLTSPNDDFAENTGRIQIASILSPEPPRKRQCVPKNLDDLSCTHSAMQISSKKSLSSQTGLSSVAPLSAVKTADSCELVAKTKTKWRCQVNGCGKVYKQKGSWAKHYKNIHLGVRYRCPYAECSHVTTQNTSLQHHIRSHHLEIRFFCGMFVCGFLYSYLG